jgi:small-conductance mechanosensitive channel
MAHMGIRRSFPTIVGIFSFWLLMCVFLMASFNIMNLESLTKAMESVVNFIPHLLVATVVVVVGLLIAGFLRGVIATSADRVGLNYAEQLANGCYYVLALMVFLGAFDQLHIKFELLNDLVKISFGGLAIGFALAAGFGGRDVMAGILAGYYLRQRMQAGDTVTIGNLEGTIREVGATATVVETEEHGLLNRHTVPNTKMLNEAVR